MKTSKHQFWHCERTLLSPDLYYIYFFLFQKEPCIVLKEVFTLCLVSHRATQDLTTGGQKTGDILNNLLVLIIIY